MLVFVEKFSLKESVWCKYCFLHVSILTFRQNIPKNRPNSQIEKKEKRQTARQTIVHTTQHRKLRTAQHEPCYKLKVIDISCTGLVIKSYPKCRSPPVAHYSTNSV